MCYCLLFVEFSFAQLSVSTTQIPDSLIKRVLVGGGVTVSNVTSQGAAVQRGHFKDKNNQSKIGITDGIILSTGDVNKIIGNANTLASSPIKKPGDADLAKIAKTTLDSTYDASIIAFDFVPSSDTISFRYVFASEEYPDWVGQGYNDVFVFLISGPGITNDPGLSGKNIAIIPGTNLPVSINNINNVSGYDKYKKYYIDNLTGQYITYNGFTTVLTAISNVNACQKYHIKLAITDVKDYYYDSGVLLEANSLSSPDIKRNNGFTKTYISTKYGYKGCSMPYVTFKKPAKEKNVSRTFNISIGGTAKDGIDYNIFDQNATHLINPTS
ncbi:MAG: choice-of-anchor L domain-containing protein, partial [Bacteroidota bacterium]|nr:choice-of-anchor L domain-containing protein [Bacteroidota bacterium]